MRKLDRLGWAVEGTYKFGSVRVGIRTTSERFGVWLDEILAEHRMTRWQVPFYSIVVADQDEPGRRNFHVLYRGVVPIVRTADLGTLARAVLEEVESHTFRQRRDAIYLGASVISGSRGVALIPSAYTPALNAQGRRAQQDELRAPGTVWTAIDPDSGTAVPVARELRIPDDAIERLAGRSSSLDRFFVDRPTPLDSLCLIHDRPDAAIEPVSRSLVLYRLAGVSENLPALGGRRTLEGLGRLVAGADCFGVAPMATNHLLETLAHLTGHPSRLRVTT